MDKYKDNGIILAPPFLLKWLQGVENMPETEKELLNTVYREISEALGIDAAMVMYRLYKGQQVSFPVRFFNTDCIKERIKREYNGENLGLLATKYGYSEKTVRRFIKIKKEEK